MPIEINGKTYYRTAEICAKTGISRATLFRWLKAGVLKKTYRDRRGWRMFTESDLETMRAEADMIKVDDNPEKIGTAEKPQR
jgi:DNA-binding transcriptional MerR regulator